MNNNNWVCFTCRRSKRQSKQNSAIPNCVYCNEQMFNLGYKVAIPKQTDKKAWKNLKESSFHRKICFDQLRFIRSVEYKHLLEKKIISLEKRPPNKHINKEVTKLKKKLELIFYKQY